MKTLLITALALIMGFISCGQNPKQKDKTTSSDSGAIVQENDTNQSSAENPIPKEKAQKSISKTVVYYDGRLVATYSNGVIQPEPFFYLQEGNSVGVKISNNYEFCSPINPNNCGVAYKKDGVACIKITSNDRAGEEGGKGGMEAGTEIRFAKASGNKIMAVNTSVYAESEFKETLFTFEGDPTMACTITFFYKHLIF